VGLQNNIEISFKKRFFAIFAILHVDPNYLTKTLLPYILNNTYILKFKVLLDPPQYTHFTHGIREKWKEICMKGQMLRKQKVLCWKKISVARHTNRKTKYLNTESFTNLLDIFSSGSPFFWVSCPCLINKTYTLRRWEKKLRNPKPFFFMIAVIFFFVPWWMTTC